MEGDIQKLDGLFLGELEQDPDRAGKLLDRLEKFLIDSNCTFRGVAMPFLLKPNFISERQSGILSHAVEKMSRILDKFVTYFLQNPVVRDIMKFSGAENDLFFIEPGYRRPLVISRLDAFMNDCDIRFLEFNCDSPAGIAYSDIMEEGFYGLFESFPFLKQWELASVYRQDLLLGSLLDCYAEFRESKKSMPERPRIAIVDWEDVSTYSEFELHKMHFEAKGYETLICSPGHFSCENGSAMVEGQEVHLVYRRVITRELVAKLDEFECFVRLIREGRVCCCNSFRSYIVGNKKVLSILIDPAHQGIFTADEVDFIRETIPWTKVLAHAREVYEGKEVDLPSFVLRNKEDLVLKPANMYGGKDVYIGRETDAGTWERIMNEHIEDESWVVQEYVQIPEGIFPDISARVELRRKYVNINPFALLGKYSGTISRVSEHPVINVSAGGGLVPTFTASERS